MVCVIAVTGADVAVPNVANNRKPEFGRKESSILRGTYSQQKKKCAAVKSLNKFLEPIGLFYEKYIANFDEKLTLSYNSFKKTPVGRAIDSGLGKAINLVTA